jgi:hypothetical protein
MAENSRVRRTKNSATKEPEKFGIVHQNPSDPTSPIIEFSTRDLDGSIIRVYMREEESPDDGKPTIVRFG